MTDTTTTDETPEPLQVLRRPFPPETIGKLPRVTCQACSKAQGRCCGERGHVKRECNVCGNYITSAHIHLDYVGHAETTDRLLTADPYWEWEPMERETDPHLMATAIEKGPETLAAYLKACPPRFVRANGQPVGLWINLTVDGVTRPGYGSIEPGKFDAEKQLIGDALRNAAMRFGVALTLWAKSELESEMDETPATTGQSAPRPAPEGGGEWPITRSGPTRSNAEAGLPEGGGLPAPPWWTEYGYVDADEAESVTESLKAILDAVTNNAAREPVRAWLREHEYLTAEGQPRAFPVRKADVPAYRDLLVTAREQSSKAAVGLIPPPSQEPTSEPQASAGADGATEPAEHPGITPEAEESIRSEVGAMKVDELKELLRQRGLPVGGNQGTLTERLVGAMVTEWVGVNAA